MKSVEEINKHFSDNKLFVSDVNSHYSDMIISVTIYDGDWKHEHGLCDYLMKELGYECFNVNEIGNSEDDCYSAERWYRDIKAAELFR